MKKQYSRKSYDKIGKTSFRTWKSGKKWIYSSTTFAILMLSIAGGLIIQNGHDKIVQADTVTSGSVSVSRTSDNLTVKNPINGVNDVTLNWDTNKDNIQMMTNLASFNAAMPFSFSVNLTSPLEVGQSITIPLTISANFKTNHKTISDYPGIMDYRYGATSPDGTFKYSISPTKGLTITAISGSNSTFLNMAANGGTTASYSITDSPWSTSTPGLLGLDPMDILNVQGSTITQKIIIGSQTTSETITNNDLLDTDDGLSTNIMPSSVDKVAQNTTVTDNGTFTGGQNSISHNAVTDLFYDLTGSDGVLDNSSDHVVVTLGNNATLSPNALDVNKNKTASSSYPQILGSSLMLANFPIGSQNGKNIYSSSAIGLLPNGLITSSFDDAVSAMSNVVKNLTVDPSKNIISFDISRNPSDWVAYAKGILTISKKDNLTLPTVYQNYLEYMVAHPGSIPDLKLDVTGSGGLYPINNQNPVQAQAKVINSKSSGVLTFNIIDTPQFSGQANATQFGIISEFVDSTGKAIQPNKTDYFKQGDMYDFTKGPTIQGYSYQSTNSKDILTSLNINDPLSNLAGTVQVNQVGTLSHVVYVYNQNVPITYSVVDDTSGKTLIEPKDFATGVIGTSVLSPSTSSQLLSLEKNYTSGDYKNYQLGKIDNENLPAPTDSAGYNIAIHLLHRTSNREVKGIEAQKVTNNKIVTRTIHYEGAGSNTPSDQVQSITFGATVQQTIDDVTGAILSESSPTWSAEGSDKDLGTFNSTTIPSIGGYSLESISYGTGDSEEDDTLDKIVKEQAVTHDDDNINVTITYSAQPAQVNVVFRDVDVDATTPNAVLAQQNIKGVTYGVYDNTMAYNAELKALEAKGYILVQADNQTGKFKPGDTTIYVDLKHNVTTTANYQVKDISQKIQYVTDKGDLVAPDNVQVLHFTNGAAIDQVTGNDIKDNWSGSLSTIEVTSPVKEGWTADKLSVIATPYSFSSKDTTIQVVYKANPQKINIQYIDVEGLNRADYSKGMILKDETQVLNGVSDDEYDNTIPYQSEIIKLEKEGYVLQFVDQGVEKGTFDHIDDKDQTYNVYLTHGRETIVGGKLDGKGNKNTEYNKLITQTVHYEGAGDQTPKDNVQTFNFSATVTYDKVTGDVIKIEWDNEQKSKIVNSPDVNDYKADRLSINSNNYDHLGKDTLFNVLYSKKEVVSVTTPSTTSTSTSSSSTPSASVLPNTGSKILKWLTTLGTIILAAVGGVIMFNYRKNRKNKKSNDIGE
jgi:LPXTG-motif cell wall-anchored protein